MKFRTHTCGQLDKGFVGKKVKLSGFVDSIRTHGKIGFVSLRDRHGVTQIFFGKEFVKDLTELRRESVIMVEGIVKKRPQANKKLKTGEVEVSADCLNVLNPAPELPLDLDVESTEETRMKYRYLDLKRAKMQDNLIIRHKVIKAMRDFFDKDDFIEVETPILAKSTPEGARDYLVPSRKSKGKFYALPQSPQIFKQLLMVAGFDKYFQIVKCMRDEDLRADRQPEFTQLDVEMSFVTEEDIYSTMEKCMKLVWKQALGVDLKIPFERITHKECMKKYKTDKPDLRKKGEKFKFLWVTDFPLFDWCKEKKRHVSAHHPFTGIREEHMCMLEDGKFEEIESKAYDLVLNGVELGSGSIRIHDREVQKKVFKCLGLSDKEAKEKFGFLMDALRFAPPHGGIALGVDRIVRIAAGEDDIREVVAFPKNKDAKDLMMDSPSKVDKEQLKELGLK